MRISKEIKISELNEELNKKYPSLKLVFYSKSHEHFEGTPADYEIKEDLALGEIYPEITDGEVYLYDDLTVEDLETELAEKYNLNAQLFRKSGDVWLQTSKTDFWSLAKQESKAT
jgi:hypothetical protein